MAGLLLFEGEELIMRFRPHILAYLRRDAFAFLWMIPAAAAAYVAQFAQGPHTTEWGLALFILLALVFGVIASKTAQVSMAYAWFAMLCASALIAAILMGRLVPPPQAWFLPLLLGGFLSVTRLLLHEIDRLNRQHFLTTERVVIRGGLARRRDRTLSLKKIQEVRSARAPLGQAFDFGDLHLVQSRSIRGKEGKVHEDVEVLRGIARLTEVQHHVEQLVEESRMPAKDRRRRLEERRVRDSMRRLAHWMRRSRGDGPQA